MIDILTPPKWYHVYIIKVSTIHIMVEVARGGWIYSPRYNR